MSDLMLTAVLSMGYDMAMADDWSRRQFYDRAQQALEEIERLRYFADLWYFVMDEAPRDFERIVAEYQPKAWLEQAAKLRRAKKERR